METLRVSSVPSLQIPSKFDRTQSKKLTFLGFNQSRSSSFSLVQRHKATFKASSIAADTETPYAPEAETHTQDDKFDWYAHWYPLMPVCDLDKRVPHAKKVLGIDVVVWWDKNESTWKVFEDACPHRLAPLSVGVNGLSTEQRKRLTIAVELVANPSIVFMDEPTSGLDARSAAIVMRTVRNIVNTGRTIVCTIHQPSIDIFESFDELLFLKRGGQLIYAGPLGPKSSELIKYFEAIEGVQKIRPGYNPAAWMLDVTSPTEESHLGVDFAEIYRRSNLFQRNIDLVEHLSKPSANSKELNFPTKYSQTSFEQFLTCLWKQNLSYWRNPQYTAVRFFYTVIISLMLGTICWRFGAKRETQQDLLNAMGSLYAAILFSGITNATAVQPVVSIERFVSYRERAAGMYSALPFAFAQVAIEFPYVFAQAVIYCTIFYSTAAFDWTLLKFVWYLFFMYFTMLYFTLYGMMTTAVTPNHNVASIIAAPFYMLWNLFSGFMIPHKRIPMWWRWYYWANPIAWSLYGLIVSQYGDDDSLVKLADGETTIPIRLVLKVGLGYRHDFLGVAGIMVAGFCILFAIIFAYAIKAFNFQRR